MLDSLRTIRDAVNPCATAGSDERVPYGMTNRQKYRQNPPNA